MKLNKGFLGLLSLFLLVSCGPSTSAQTTSDAPTTEPSISDTTTSTDPSISDPITEPSTSVPVEWVDLQTAVENTKKGYILSAIGFNTSMKHIIEFNVDNLYGYTLTRMGYVILEEDSQFVHSLKIDHFYNEYEVNDYKIEVFGRLADKSVFKDAIKGNVFDAFGASFDSFVKIEDGLYRYSGQEMGHALKDYFQSNLVKYCNEFDITISPEGYLKDFYCYESYDGQRSQVVHYGFEPATKKEDVKMFKTWRDNGSIINVNLADYKNLYQPSRFSEAVSVYENTEVNLELVVSTSDVDNNLYAGLYDERYGFLGMQIKGHGSEFEPGDIIKVKGTIKTKNFVVYIDNATITDLNKKADYSLVYDEEAVSTVYGGGVYAAQLFLNNPPFYAGSLYSTYGYYTSYQEMNALTDTKISIAFPSFMIDTNTPLIIDLIIPMELDQDVKDSIYKTIKNSMSYNDLVPTELEIQNSIIRFDESSKYYLSLEATNNTIVRQKPTAKQKINEVVGLENFPIPDAESISAFKFGVFNTVFIEDIFARTSDTHVQGVYLTADGYNESNFSSYVSELNDYGFVLIEITKDIQNKTHYVFSNNQGAYASVALVTDDYYSESAYIEMFIYANETPVLPALVEEKLEALVGDYFDMDNFFRFSGTYDYDYQVFELTSYAGTSYEENPLICYTINVDSSTDLSNYAKELIRQHGYKQYKVDGVPYSYNTRGQSHLVLTDPTGKVFFDMAVYHTSDYTYSGHDEFEYRIEVLVYEGTKPITHKTYDDLSILTSIHGKVNPKYDYAANVELPEGTVVEYWADVENFIVDYGFGCRDEVFIYLKPNEIDAVWDQLYEAIVAAGYKESYGKENRQAFSITDNGQYLFVSIMKETEKGYIRLMNDVLGASFV